LLFPLFLDVMLRVISTTEERTKIIHAVHEGLGSTDEAVALAGHIGRDKAMAKILERYAIAF
jgi:hypothetical protein